MPRPTFAEPTTITEPSDLLLLREDLTLDQIEARAGVLYAGTGRSPTSCISWTAGGCTRPAG